MVDPTFCIGNLYCGITVAHILLWLLVFAVVYGILSVLKIFGSEGKMPKKVNAIIAIVMAFFVLIAAPGLVLTVLASMTNSFVTLAMVVIILMALLSIAGVYTPNDKDGMWQKNGKWIAAILVLIAIVVFVGAGGLALIGVGSIPSVMVSPGIIVLILVGIAILWLASN